MKTRWTWSPPAPLCSLPLPSPRRPTTSSTSNSHRQGSCSKRSSQPLPHTALETRRKMRQSQHQPLSQSHSSNSNSSSNNNNNSNVIIVIHRLLFLPPLLLLLLLLPLQPSFSRRLLFTPRPKMTSVSCVVTMMRMTVVTALSLSQNVLSPQQQQHNTLWPTSHRWSQYTLLSIYHKIETWTTGRTQRHICFSHH